MFIRDKNISEQSSVILDTCQCQPRCQRDTYPLQISSAPLSEYATNVLIWSDDKPNKLSYRIEQLWVSSILENHPHHPTLNRDPPLDRDPLQTKTPSLWSETPSLWTETSSSGQRPSLDRDPFPLDKDPLPLNRKPPLDRHPLG